MSLKYVLNYYINILYYIIEHQKIIDKYAISSTVDYVEISFDYLRVMRFVYSIIFLE